MNINRLEMFITDDIAERINELKPWEKCEKCRAGYKSISEFCSCTEQTVIEQILNIPERYKVKFESPAYEKRLPDIIDKPFLILKGAELYVKLIGFDIARKKMESGKITVYVHSRSREMNPADLVAISQADVILFDDMASKMTDVNYRIELMKRMDRNKQTIFLHSPVCINLEGEPDVVEFDVDSIGIKIK